MSGQKINQLMDIWAAHQQHRYGDDDPNPPFASSQNMYNVIDATEVGGVQWQSFMVTYNGALPKQNPPTWMSASYEVWFRDPLAVMEEQIGNRDFGYKMDYALKRVFSKLGKRQFSDFMSGNWAWNQVVRA